MSNLARVNKVENIYEYIKRFNIFHKEGSECSIDFKIIFKASEKVNMDELNKIIDWIDDVFDDNFNEDEYYDCFDELDDELFENEITINGKAIRVEIKEYSFYDENCEHEL